MENVDLIKDISKRTNGDIYLGVVGAVRTGKSTFIKKFMEKVVIPNMEDEQDRVRTQDELPQSSAGRTIMTTEPKFVPNQAVQLEVDEGLFVNVRLKEVGKPFIMILNSTKPYNQETEILRLSLNEEYDIPVLAMSAENMNE